MQTEIAVIADAKLDGLEAYRHDGRSPRARIANIIARTVEPFGFTQKQRTKTKPGNITFTRTLRKNTVQQILVAYQSDGRFRIRIAEQNSNEKETHLRIYETTTNAIPPTYVWEAGFVSGFTERFAKALSEFLSPHRHLSMN